MCLDHRSRSSAALALLWLMSSILCQRAPAAEQTVEQLKVRFKDASITDRPKLGVQIAQRQMAEADKQYAANNLDQGKTALAVAATYSEL